MSNRAGYRQWLDRYILGQPERSHGIVLVAVLWIVTSLTVLVLSFNASVRSHLDVSSSELSIAHAEASIESAVRFAVLKLREPNPKMRWASDGRAYDVALVGRNVRIAIQDQQGLIDLNGASAELLASLLRHYVDNPDQAKPLAMRIIDWRDPDHDISKGGGAEDAAYTNAGLKGAGDRPFADTIELDQVMGVSSQLSQRLTPYLTVYGSGRPANASKPTNTSQQPKVPQNRKAALRPNPAKKSSGTKVNIVTAPVAVLKVLPNMTANKIARIKRLRKQLKPDKNALLAGLSQSKHLITAAQPGPAFQLRIDITDPALVPAAALVTVLLRPQGKEPFHILEWRSVRPIPR